MLIVKIGGGEKINAEGIIKDLAALNEKFIIIHGANAVRDNLLNEGVSGERIIVTGNTGIDTLFMTVNKDYHHEFLTDYHYDRLILMTAHRRENFGMPMRCIFEAVANLARRNPGFLIVYPVHLNQNVQQPAHQILGEIANVRLLDPLSML